MTEAQHNRQVFQPQEHSALTLPAYATGPALLPRTADPHRARATSQPSLVGTSISCTSPVCAWKGWELPAFHPKPSTPQTPNPKPHPPTPWPVDKEGPEMLRFMSGEPGNGIRFLERLAHLGCQNSRARRGSGVREESTQLADLSDTLHRTIGTSYPQINCHKT